MMTKSVGSLGFAWICCMLALGSCFGATYSIVFDGPLGVQGSTAFSIDVYLQETVSGAELTVLGDPTLGAISGNFEVSILGGSSALSKVTGNTAFDTYGGDATSGPWVVTQADLVVADGTPYGNLTAPGVYRILLGTIFGTSSDVSEFFEFQISDPFASPSDDLVLGDATVLDGIVFPSSKYSLLVTGNSAVPEPSMCLIFGTALIAVPYGKWRKRSA
ncbi:MAG: hypothetical protein ACKN85_15335 [Pirellula sp.]